MNVTRHLEMCHQLPNCLLLPCTQFVAFFRATGGMTTALHAQGVKGMQLAKVFVET